MRTRNTSEATYKPKCRANTAFSSYIRSRARFGPDQRRGWVPEAPEAFKIWLINLASALSR